MRKQVPAPVLRPVTGRYLLTPTTWSPEEKQALYQIQDRDALLVEMAGAFGCSISDLDQPEEVFLAKIEDTEFFEIGSGDKVLSMQKDGFVKIQFNPLMGV